jgi:hypothetical protein
MNIRGKGCVGLWVSAGSKQRNTEARSSTARSRTACVGLSGAVVERGHQCYATHRVVRRASGRTQRRINTDQVEEAY